MGAGQMLCLRAALMEEDSSTGELSGDDDFGADALLLSFEGGWAGKHVLHLHGPGENAVDVTVDVSMQ
jgi:hypothetical protein